jgi:HD-GYP domain-containing protein (c-di-GMP phosphodiesterase class II)
MMEQLTTEPNDVPTVHVYAAIVAGGACMTVGLLLIGGESLGAPLVVLALCLVAAAAERGSIRLTSDTEQSISLLPTLFAAVLFGPLAGAIVGAASNIADFRSPYLKWIVYTSTRTMAGALAGVVALFSSRLAESPLGSIVAATVVAGIVLSVLDLGFSVLTYKVKQYGQIRDVLRILAPVVLPSVPLWMPVVAFLAFAYREISPWTLALFFVPALAAHRSFVLYQEQRRLAAGLSAANAHLERANLSFAAALVATLDARDRYTAGHSAAVAIYSRDIACRLGLPAEEQRRAHLCGLVHDIGKIGLPVGLLEKQGPLTLDERRIMQEHSPIGERILAKVDDYSEIARIVRHHHERVDGNGYPDHRAGDDIPLLSRIIAVADAYNAMTSDRPYREAMPSRVARLRLAQAVESQFDTTVVAAFEAILASSSDAYRSGTSAEFRMVLQHDDEDAYGPSRPLSLASAS